MSQTLQAEVVAWKPDDNLENSEDDLSNNYEKYVNTDKCDVRS